MQLWGQAGPSSRGFFFGGCGQLFAGRNEHLFRASAGSGHGEGAHGGPRPAPRPVLRALHAGRGQCAHELTRLRPLPSGLASVPAASLLPQPHSRHHPSCCRPAVLSGRGCPSLLSKHLLSSASLVQAGPPRGVQCLRNLPPSSAPCPGPPAPQCGPGLRLTSPSAPS